MKQYNFYYQGNLEEIHPLDDRYNAISNPFIMYDYLSNGVWREETAAPRMQKDWSKNNKTLGQCSITAFLVQDIFGGEVYGVPLEDGNFHCFNVINNIVFDLTSEQFQEKKLDYTLNFIQSREKHFDKIEKYKRYLMLKNLLINSAHIRILGDRF